MSNHSKTPPLVATPEDGIKAAMSLETIMSSNNSLDTAAAVKADYASQGSSQLGPIIHPAQIQDACCSTTSTPQPPAAAALPSDALDIDPDHAHNQNPNHEAAAGSDNSHRDALVHIPIKNREFVCMNDEYSDCLTGQITKSLSRKVISNHFGRNKACTRIIQDWPLFCRKHYQRATYKLDLWQRRKINLILRQFDIIEKQYPGTVYEVRFKKAEEARLNEYSRKVTAGMPVADAAALVAPDADIKSFQAPISVLRELEDYLGKGKSIDTVKAAVELILELLDAKDTTEIPSIEFLPGLTKTKAPAVARVSAKGAVKKPTKA